MKFLQINDKLGAPRCLVGDPQKDLLFVGQGYKLYLASTPDGTKSGFLRLPERRQGNAAMQLEVEKLNFLASASEDTEAAYQKVKNDPDARVHYDWLFPTLVDSFVSNQDQDFRQGNLLGAKDADLRDFFALPKLMSKYKVDAKTAAWILGRFFKMQIFTEEVGIRYNFYPDQVVLEPKMHRMVYLGWYLSDIDAKWDNVAHASKCILDFVQPDESPGDEAFMKTLELLSAANGMTGEQAHRILYATIDKYWGYKYHPFTYFDKKTTTWHRLDGAEIFNP